MPDPYDPIANPNFLAALVAYWLATPGLLAVSPAPYGDQAPMEVDPPYCVLSETATTLGGRGSKTRSYWEETFYQFAVYHHDQAQAVLLGLAMVDLLDPIQDRKLRFANGYQQTWFRESARLLEVPEVNKAGARTIWQQAHTYKLSVGRLRP
jgi:hypothetical protein